MSILDIKNLEKHEEHTVIFSEFSLSIFESNVIAIHATTNVRSIFLKMIMGEVSISNGEIKLYEQHINKSVIKTLSSKVGFFLLDDGLYERLTVKDSLLFYRDIYKSELSIEDCLRFIQLEGKKKTRICNLSYSEKRRVHFGRLLLQNPNLFIFEVPDQNVDLESKRIFTKIVRELSQQGKAILLFTDNIESSLLFTNQVYRLDESGLNALDINSEEELVNAESAATVEDLEQIAIQPVRFEKIPTKVNDKIILFDPPEIDYIESNEGHSNIYIKGDTYPSVFTMAELETRLLPYGFFRCHRSYIVNLQKVREVITFTRNSFSLVLNDTKKSQIPLSKAKMTELKGMLGLK
ncbi:LytTR family transcriptional regulator DNA-binding domain-containing protein [Metabacillus malikii]|uniref:ABC-2 type transport system ATP-binding protein n=1 Tax=Metabacillus malikii TaxID=1504265 RepID=A0ABT9ZF30_9BACI|nr:LytTR family transcriptional regulator DNA-binding domain-containing protein [Metabacillus malikii]MDQ0230876.1 ABC-2 type transport system ATP-binding protein [Metabacillus malikii]